MSIVVNLDLETFSTAGMIWDAAADKWRPIIKGREGGLPAVGHDVYCRHESTEALIVCYEFPGQKVQTWVPGVSPPPEDLFAHVRNGGLISAFNSLFEWLIWTYVLVPKHGFPPLPLENTRDAAALTRLYGLPGALKKAAAALNIAEQKIDMGTVDSDSNLIRWFSCPRSPSKNDPRKRRYLGEHPDKAEAYYRYCQQDVRVEKALGDACPPQSDYELCVWQLDQKINQRGVAIDVDAVEDLVAVVEAVTVKRTEELVRLTNGALQTVNEVEKMRDFLALYGIKIPDVKADTVKDVLDDPKHSVHEHPWAVRVLQIRQELASASVKKLYAIRSRICDDGRLRGLFAYCGAERTGRWAGRGVQVHNLPRGSAKVFRCDHCLDCGGTREEPCNCGGTIRPKKWCHEAALSAIASFKGEAAGRSVEETYATAVINHGENVLDVVVGCLRALFIAGPGMRFVVSDYRAIEAVVLAALAGEEWRMDVFRTHGHIYELSASRITGIPFEEYARYKTEHGENHPTRNAIGKIAELACLGADTEVLTDSGWKRIVDVTTMDLLHDGVEWIEHGGVVSRGNRLTEVFAGVTVTPDHKVFVGEDQWRTMEDLKGSIRFQNQAIDTASSLLNASFPEMKTETYIRCAGVIAVAPALPRFQISAWGSRLDAPRVGGSGAPRRARNMHTFVPTVAIDDGFLGASAQRTVDAWTATTGSTFSTEGPGSGFTYRGSSTDVNGCGTCAPSPGGMIPSSPSIESKTTWGMSRGTYVSSHTENSRTTRPRLSGSSTQGSGCLRPSSTNASPRTLATRTSSERRCNEESLQKVSSSDRTTGACACTSLEGTSGSSTPESACWSRSSTDASPRTTPCTLSPTASSEETRRKSSLNEVFDVLNVGPRSRFVIRTSAGPLIVHNSGFGGGWKSWKKFGADKHMTEDEMKVNVKKWRAASPKIVNFWYDLERGAIAAIDNPGQSCPVRGVTYHYDNKVLRCYLPSGRPLVYQAPEVEWGKTPWGSDKRQITFAAQIKGNWVRDRTYSGKLCENIVQAVARDIMAHGMLQAAAKGFSIAMHVHDEIICEEPVDSLLTIADLESAMGDLPAWAADWPVIAQGGWSGREFRKD